MEYEVVWRIQLDAETPDEAARMALTTVRDSFSDATFFEVTNRETGETETIDAAEVEIAEDLAGLDIEDYTEGAIEG